VPVPEQRGGASLMAEARPSGRRVANGFRISIKSGPNRFAFRTI
jgi:hypothetical protein